MAMIVKAAKRGADLRPHVKAPSPVVAELSEPIDPDLLPPDLRTRREVAYALCFASRFEDWLAKWVAWHGWSRDDVEPAASRLALLVREFLMARALHPEAFPAGGGQMGRSLVILAAPVDDDEDNPDLSRDYGAPATEVDAAYYGLHVERAPRKRERLAPTMPGCWGVPDGQPCPSLRVRGHKFCPTCERAERQRIREAQGRE